MNYNPNPINLVKQQQKEQNSPQNKTLILENQKENQPFSKQEQEQEQEETTKVLTEEKKNKPLLNSTLNDSSQFKLVKSTGRRKSSIARVLLKTGTGLMTINRKESSEYLQKSKRLLETIQAPLDFLKFQKEKVDITILVNGGGLVGQADAIKLGISRALCEWNNQYRPSLKLKGYLMRDARVKERKKYGLKKARKAPQFSKR